MSLSPWFIVGAGYTGTALARRLIAEGETVVVTRRSAAAAEALAAELGCQARVLDLALPIPIAVGTPNAIVVSCAPPGADPAAEIANLITFAGPARLVYVSSTGVYAPGH